MKNGRYEIKYILPKTSFLVAKQRIAAVMPRDIHDDGCGYRISSLYFDDYLRSAYFEKLNGEDSRKKYRIRIYNNSSSFIRLECKKRIHGFIVKESCPISIDDYSDILSGAAKKNVENSAGVLQNFLLAQKLRCLSPVVVVDYERLAYADLFGTRVSFDSSLCASLGSADLFSPHKQLSSILDNEHYIMEIKFNGKLPDYVQNVLCGLDAQVQSVSKYVLCMQRKGMVRHYA